MDYLEHLNKKLIIAKNGLYTEMHSQKFNRIIISKGYLR